MNYAKKLQLTTIIVYAIIASIASKFLDIHWIHILNALMLSAILYHLLEWKYSWTEQDESQKEI